MIFVSRPMISNHPTVMTVIFHWYLQTTVGEVDAVRTEHGGQYGGSQTTNQAREICLYRGTGFVRYHYIYMFETVLAAQWLMRHTYKQ